MNQKKFKKMNHHEFIKRMDELGFPKEKYIECPDTIFLCAMLSWSSAENAADIAFDITGQLVSDSIFEEFKNVKLF